MELINIDHMVLTVSDIEKTLAFYRDILGMEVKNQNGRYSLHFGAEKINLHQAKGEFQPAAENPTYGSADFCLIAKGDIRKIKEEIEAKGYPIELGIVPREGAKGEMESLYLRDPDYNLIELAVYLSVSQKD